MPKSYTALSGAIRDGSAEAKRRDAAIATRIIRKAERDLGPLTPGQRRDLVADQCDSWTLARVAEAVQGARP